LPQLSLILVANLLPVSLTPVATALAILVEKKFSPVPSYTGGKFAAGVFDTSGKFVTSIVDSGGEPWLGNISANFQKI
jgi:hypothetical protein